MRNVLAPKSYHVQPVYSVFCILQNYRFLTDIGKIHQTIIDHKFTYIGVFDKEKRS